MGHLVELVAPHSRLRSGRPGQHRRRRAVLLFRGKVTAARRGVGVIREKAAKAFGLAIPQSLLLRADAVIE